MENWMEEKKKMYCLKFQYTNTDSQDFPWQTQH